MITENHVDDQADGLIRVTLFDSARMAGHWNGPLGQLIQDNATGWNIAVFQRETRCCRLRRVVDLSRGAMA